MLAILTTHPIQYQVPLWQALARAGDVPFEVWYLTDHGARAAADREFGRTFAWDVPLLEGYAHRFLRVNRAATVEGGPLALRLAEPLEVRLRENKITHLWIHGWHKFALWQAMVAARRAGVRVWLRGESNDLAPVASWKRPVKRLVLRRLFRRVDAFLCIGSANRRLYRAFGVPPARLHWTPYGVDHDRFAAAAEALAPQRSELRRHWQIADDAFCVLFCGKFIAKKRPLDLVAAASRGAAGRPLHLLFVGSGELDSALRASTRVVGDAANPSLQASPAAAGDVRPTATFAGFLNQTEVARAYVAADCLVLPSDAGETWGLVVNEAMACGLPCIVSDLVGCGEDLVEPIRPMLRFPMGNVAALAAALHLVDRDPPSAAVLQNHVLKFDFARTVRSVAELYARSQPASALVSKVAGCRLASGAGSEPKRTLGEAGLN